MKSLCTQACIVKMFQGPSSKEQKRTNKGSKADKEDQRKRGTGPQIEDDITQKIN